MEVISLRYLQKSAEFYSGSLSIKFINHVIQKMILHDNILDGPQYIFLYKNEFHKIFFIRPFSQAKAIA